MKKTFALAIGAVAAMSLSIAHADTSADNASQPGSVACKVDCLVSVNPSVPGFGRSFSIIGSESLGFDNGVRNSDGTPDWENSRPGKNNDEAYRNAEKQCREFGLKQLGTTDPKVISEIQFSSWLEVPDYFSGPRVTLHDQQGQCDFSVAADQSVKADSSEAR